MKITASNENEFREQFKAAIQSHNCKTIKNVVYFLRTETPIPRVIGESNIVYIGQTSKTFNSRYCSKWDFEIEVSYFNRFYIHVIKKYGAISIDIRATNNPKYAEWEELQNYYRAHLEYPPLNRAIPSKPKAVITNELSN